MPEPRTTEVHAAVQVARERMHYKPARIGADVWDMVKARVEHGLAEIELAFPTEIHDWVPVPEGSALTHGHAFRFCAVCDREELVGGPMNGALLRDGVRPCTFERRPPNDPALR